jgi:hypothetical protein
MSWRGKMAVGSDSFAEREEGNRYGQYSVEIEYEDYVSI